MNVTMAVAVSYAARGQPFSARSTQRSAGLQRQPFSHSKRSHVWIRAEGRADAQASTTASLNGAYPPTAAAPASLTERMFRQMEQNNAAGSESAALGAGGATSYEALKRADAAWRQLRTRKVWGPRPQFIRESKQAVGAPLDCDVLVCGGTLGIFLAASLQLRGLSVAVVERGPLLGRAQEWNISRKEMEELVELGVLTQQEVEDCVSIEFNPVRVGFHTEQPGGEVWTRDVLNLGVSPARLVAAARERFEAAGGRVLELTPLSGVTVHPDGVSVQLGGSSSSSSSSGGGSGSPPQRLTAALLLDCMGHASPIVQQVRWGQKPDGVCLVVGSCARGFDPASNTTGDVIFTNSHSQPPAPGSASSSSGGSSSGAAAEGLHNTQLFWEAFPAGSGPGDRTTYMFTYLDAEPSRPSLEAMLEEYWRLMPQYQGVALEQLQMLRILFGWFPTYRGSPLAPAFDRVLQVGDASGIQSPLSFGGFGALTRHLGRLTGAISEALETGMVDKRSLALINAYNPGLSGAWMLQRAMSIRADAAAYRADFINRLLAANFKAMEELGEPTLKPFLQDVIQLKPLVQTMGKQMLADPLMVPQIIARVGLPAMADWLLHLAGLAAYTFLDWDVQKYNEVIEKLPPRPRYLLHRAQDNWRYGAGKDYKL